MIYRITLEDNPTWWKNFCNQDKIPSDLRRELREYHVRYSWDSVLRKAYVEFDDEQYASMFILRYS
ncbi:MAG TPA: hypothetical protein DCE78_02325 [Bacteroidetes bacterium]|nr:hypothetical protein [Bacteroidota bacterium]